MPKSYNYILKICSIHKIVDFYLRFHFPQSTFCIITCHKPLFFVFLKSLILFVKFFNFLSLQIDQNYAAVTTYISYITFFLSSDCNFTFSTSKAFILALQNWLALLTPISSTVLGIFGPSSPLLTFPKLNAGS